MHVNINKQDTVGNNGKGRFFIVPGSRNRAQKISNFLTSITIKNSSRGHDLYLGKIKDTNIDVGVVSTGMGCPSIDIIITELIDAGAKLFIRIGTSGSLSHECPKGHIVIASTAVRDESTSKNYAPLEFPAMADRELVNSLEKNCQLLDFKYKVGIVHTKDSLYVREFNKGPLAQESQVYMQNLEKLGVLASEMECSHFYILGHVYKVKCATICSVIGNKDDPFGLSEVEIGDLEQKTIKVTLKTIEDFFEF